MGLAPSRCEHTKKHFSEITNATTTPPANVEMEEDEGKTSKQLDSKAVKDVDKPMSDLAEALAHLTLEDKKPPLHIFDLPQELQDIIFELAFPTVEGFTIVTKRTWEDRELESWRKSPQTYHSRPYPSVKVNEFLVSKRFFLSAARAFVSQQTFHINASDGHWALFKNGVIRPFLNKAEVKSFAWYGFIMIVGYPSALKHLVIEVHEHDFRDAVSPKFVWEQPLTKKDLMAVIRELKLDQITGLKKLEIKPARFNESRPEEIPIWQANVRSLERLAIELTTKPKVQMEESNVRDGSAMYVGSRVSMTTAEILKEDSVSRNVAHQSYAQALRVRDLPSDPEALIELIRKNGDQVGSLITRLKERENSQFVGYML